ncbi:MAG: TlyA family RNA methyltransferase [Aquificaceae bacterium]
MQRERIDKKLIQLGFAPTREKAQALIMAGSVFVDGRLVDKPGLLVKEGQRVEVKERAKYVSRGGYKLENALKHFGIDVRGYTVLDVGSSTGGFTDCLLQAGANKVYAVDVGKFQMDIKLRSDPRVVLHEETDAREITQKHVQDKVDLITVDVSFISVVKVLPNIVKFLKEEGILLILVKPQFELTPDKVRKGIVRKDEYKEEAVLKVSQHIMNLGFNIYDIVKAKPKGTKGNEEFFILSGKNVAQIKNPKEIIKEAVKQNSF